MQNAWEASWFLATDPDCDRVGIGVKNIGREITGRQETGVLLLDYVARRRRESRNYASRTDFRENHFTSDLAGKVAQSYGIEMRDVIPALSISATDWPFGGRRRGRPVYPRTGRKLRISVRYLCAPDKGWG